MKRTVLCMLAALLAISALSGCGVPKDKPVPDVWIGDTLETVQTLETGLEESRDVTGSVVTGLSGARDYAGTEGTLVIKFNPEKQTVAQISWQATLSETDAKTLFDKLYAEAEAGFGKPDQINDNTQNGAIAPYICFWNGKGYMLTVALTNGLLDGTYYCAYSVMIPLR